METLNEIQISYKNTNTLQHKITSSAEAYALLKNNWNGDHLELLEEVKILYLNQSNMVLGIYNHSKGGINQSIVDVRHIFSIALLCNSTGLIIAHNHPSGNLKPSKDDLDITKRIKEIGKLHTIQLLDHLIITKDSYYSFSDNGDL